LIDSFKQRFYVTDVHPKFHDASRSQRKNYALEALSYTREIVLPRPDAPIFKSIDDWLVAQIPSNIELKTCDAATNTEEILYTQSQVVTHEKSRNTENIEL